MKKIILITILAFLVISAVVLGIKIFSKETEKIPQIPFPTGIQTEEIAWEADSCFVYYTRNKVYRYCLEGNSEEILSIEELYSDVLFREVKISQNFLCDTYNFSIESIDQEATRIYVYDISDSENPIILSTSLTIKTDICEDILSLSNTFPFQEESYYSWNIKEKQPEESQTSNTETILSQDENNTVVEYKNMRFIFPLVASFNKAIVNPNRKQIALIDDETEVWIFDTTSN